MAQSRGFPFVRKMVCSFPDEFLLISVDLLNSFNFRSLQPLSVKDRLPLINWYWLP